MLENRFKLAGALAALFLVTLPLSCQNDSQSSSAELLTLLALSNFGLSGTATKGPVSGGTVLLYTLNGDGTLSGPLEETTTDTQGRFRFRNRYQNERLEIQVSGGTYVDEATGDTIQLRDQTRLRLQIATHENLDDVSLSPLTTMAALRTRVRLESGIADADGAIVQARQEVSTMFGISDIDPGTTSCDDLTNPDAAVARNRLQTRYGLILAGLSQVAQDNGVSPDDVPALVYCYGEDLQDGDIDGSNGAGSIVCSAGIDSLSAHTALEQAMNNFMVNQRNRHQSELQGMSIPTPVLP